MQSPLVETKSAPAQPLEAIPYATDGTQFATLAEVTAVVIRICAVITFFQTIGWIGYIVGMIKGESDYDVYPLTVPAAQSIVGVLLWCFADPLSRFFAPPRALPLVSAGVMMERLQRVAFATAGIILLVQAIADVPSSIVYYHQTGTSSVFYTTITAAMILRILIAVWLIIGNERIRLLWRKLRSPDFR